MPNYDYQCEKCGNLFEVFQSMNDKKLTKCPDGSCSGRVQRLLGTGAGIIFKGSGFYGTDYRSESYKAGEKAAQKASKEQKGQSSDKKKEPKSASKPSNPKAG
ncbi:MAG: FmdB family zinc ribbon protein [Verrucomicrobiales bacterium]